MATLSQSQRVLSLWEREQSSPDARKTVSAEQAMLAIADRYRENPPNNLLGLTSLLQLKGKPYTLKRHFPMEPMFRLNLPTRAIWRCGRQVSKSTSLAAQGVLMSARIPHFSLIFVTPLYEQIRRFSSNYVRPFLTDGLIGQTLMTSKTEDSVLQKTFLNSTRMYFTFAYLNCERARGLPGDFLVFDETVCALTNILTRNGPKKLIDCNPNDMVQSFLPDGRIVWRRIIKNSYHGYRARWKLKLSNGASVSATSESWIYTSLGWLRVSAIIEKLRKANSPIDSDRNSAACPSKDSAQRGARGIKPTEDRSPVSDRMPSRTVDSKACARQRNNISNADTDFNTDTNAIGHAPGRRLHGLRSKLSALPVKSRLVPARVQLSKGPDIIQVRTYTTQEEEERRLWRMVELFQYPLQSSLRIYSTPVLSQSRDALQEDCQPDVARSADLGGASLVVHGRRLPGCKRGIGDSQVSHGRVQPGRERVTPTLVDLQRHRMRSSPVPQRRQRSVLVYPLYCARNLETGGEAQSIHPAVHAVQDQITVPTNVGHVPVLRTDLPTDVNYGEKRDQRRKVPVLSGERMLKSSSQAGGQEILIKARVPGASTAGRRQTVLGRARKSQGQSQYVGSGASRRNKPTEEGQTHSLCGGESAYNNLQPLSGSRYGTEQEETQPALLQGLQRHYKQRTKKDVVETKLLSRRYCPQKLPAEHSPAEEGCQQANQDVRVRTMRKDVGLHSEEAEVLRGLQRGGAETALTLEPSEIVKIEFDGYGDVYDLEVEGTATFIAGGVAIHNCQDMDPDFIPIISSSLDASEDWGLIQYSGTPKTMDNISQLLWEKSSQAEWLMKCEACNHWNIPNLDHGVLEMILPKGLVCQKCEALLNPIKGQWEHAFPDRFNSFVGYHAPQIIFPMHYALKDRWTRLYNRKVGEPTGVFTNEVLAESCDVGQKLITLTELKAACQLPINNDITEAIEYVSEEAYVLTVLGVDWGGGGLSETSFTTASIVCLRPDGVLEVPFMYRIRQGYRHDEEARLLLNIWQQFRCKLFAHDFGGAGSARETIMITSGMLKSHVMPMLYVPVKSGPMIEHRQGRRDVRSWYSIDKPRSLLFLTSLIRAGGVLFPKYASCTSELNDFLSLVEDKVTTRLRSDIYVVTKNQKATDDIAHSTNLGALAAFHSQEAWPKLADSFNVSVSNEVMSSIVDPRLLENPSWEEREIY